MPDTIASVAGQARACTRCADSLPRGPRPILRVSSSARVLIIGQAPGTRVDETGIPWNDSSGNRLRAWMAISSDDFYDEARVAIMPMGLCYPGVLPKGGDVPPMPICAPTWHPLLLPLMPKIAIKTALIFAKHRRIPTKLAQSPRYESAALPVGNAMPVSISQNRITNASSRPPCPAAAAARNN